MRFLAILFATCALFQTAAGQTGECKSIADSSQRLACYDRAAPAAKPSSARQPPTTTVAASSSDNAKFIDKISAEDALMNARLKNICRGC